MVWQTGDGGGSILALAESAATRLLGSSSDCSGVPTHDEVPIWIAACSEYDHAVIHTGARVEDMPSLEGLQHHSLRAATRDRSGDQLTMTTSEAQHDGLVPKHYSPVQHFVGAVLPEVRPREALVQVPGLGGSASSSMDLLQDSLVAVAS